MKIGDKIKCVKFDNGLIIGQEYEVFSYQPTWCGHDTPVITVEKDGATYYADYFTLSKTETKMKQNDKIKCINSKDSESLNRGSIYVVTDINQYNNIQVKPLNGQPLQHYYKPERFELVEEFAPSVVKIDPTKKYKTVDGREVKILAISNDAKYPVVGQICDDGEWYNEQWTIKGEIFEGEFEPCNSSLVEVMEDIVLEYPERNIIVKINQDLSVSMTNKFGLCIAFIAPEVMEATIEAYQKMKKQCNS